MINNGYLKRLKQEYLFPRSPAPPPPPVNTPREWRDRYAVMLSWSNPEADDDLLLLKALKSGRWSIILSAARIFGAPRMTSLWIDIREDDDTKALQSFIDMLMRRAALGRFE